MIEEAIDRCRGRIAALAAERLPGARGEDELAALLEGVWAIVDEELAAARPAGSPAPACGPGCVACCTLNVGTLAIEGVAAARHLRRRHGPDGVAALAADLGAFHDRVRWLEDRERIAGRITCPLADGEGRCTIHPARPLACRSVSSLDPAECRRALDEREEDEPGLVRMDWLQRSLHDAARATLAEALRERGLDARCRDVSGMTAAFLADPASAEGFLAGARVGIE